MALIKVKEVIGTSPRSFQQALDNAVKYAHDQKKNVTGVKVLSQTAEVQEGKVVEYKVNVKIAYRWEKELHEE